MTPDQPLQAGPDDRHLTPEDVRGVGFHAGGMLHPGYDAAEVEKFRALVADELERATAERDQLWARVRSLEEQLAAVEHREPPSDQAVRILSVAQQTADQYVAEAEDFSRQMTSDARAQHEEQLRTARETAGSIIQAAHETAARMVESGAVPAAGTAGMDPEKAREEVAYLKAFGQAVRVQLRSYLEALITDVETEWGQASPHVVQGPLRTAAQRSGDDGAIGPLNVVAEVPAPGESGAEVSRARG